MTQESRKAIIELLFLALYMDNHLSLAEDGVLTEALDSLGWESEKPREAFIFTAFASSREAFKNLESTQAYFSTRTDVIRKDGTEAEAMTWLTRVLAADGLTGTEKYFLNKVQEKLFP